MTREKFIAGAKFHWKEDKFLIGLAIIWLVLVVVSGVEIWNTDYKVAGVTGTIAIVMILIFGAAG